MSSDSNMIHITSTNTMTAEHSHYRNHNNERFFVFLLLLRYISAFHLVLSAIYPTNEFLFQSASIQLSFLICLSSFTLTLRTIHENQQNRIIKNPQLFYVSRFIKIIPFHFLSVLLYEICFSTPATLSHRLLRFIVTVCFLSPYLSPTSPFVYSINDSPYIAPNLLPSLVLAYLVYPVILQVYPKCKKQNTHSIIICMICTYLLTGLQAYWLVSYNIINQQAPQLYERRLTFFDLVTYIPFCTNLFPFLFGIACAIYFVISKPIFAFYTLPVRCLRFCLSVTALVLFTSLCIPLFSYSSDSKSTLFYSAWVSTGLLLPLYVSVIFSAASLFTCNFHPLDAAISTSSTTSTALIPTSTLAQFDTFSTYVPLTSDRTPNIIRQLSTFSLSYYLFSSSIYRFLSNQLCPSSVKFSLFKLTFTKVPLICLSPIVSPSATQFQLFSIQPLSVMSYTGARLSVFFYLPISVIFVLFVSVFFVNPVISIFYSFMIKFIESSSLSSSFLSDYLYRNYVYKSPSRNIPSKLLYLKIGWFYCMAILFFSVALQLTLPSRYLPYHENQFLCFLFFSCIPEHKKFWDVGIGLVFKNAINLFKWVMLFNLPTMLSSIIGHLLYPRPKWKKFPSVLNMVRYYNSKGEGEEQNGNGNTHVNNPTKSDLYNENVEKQISDLKLTVDFKLYFRYVTRGMNAQLIKKNVNRAISILSNSGLSYDLWNVEVVSDIELNLDKEINNKKYMEIIVPKEYKAKNGTKFKARALQYAINHSIAKETDWIIHLDEETTFDKDTIQSIFHHCVTESYKTYKLDEKKYPNIGQGLIIYNGYPYDMNSNWLLKLADCGRVADDCGKFRLQYEFHNVWIGMHGSFIVINNKIEKLITFDHGIRSSIAEDAYFALLSKSKGIRFSWIDSIMYEQSPFSWFDFIKQRSRWLVGGILVIQSNQISLKYKWTMMIFIIGWCLMPFTYPTIFIYSLLFKSFANTSYHIFDILIAVITSISIWNYIFGFCVSFSVKQLGVIKFLTLLFMMIGCLPLFAFMESIAVCHALWNFTRNVNTFHVIQKESNVNNSNTETSKPLTYGSTCTNT